MEYVDIGARPPAPEPGAGGRGRRSHAGRRACRRGVRGRAAVCAPGGYSWQPGAGDKVLVLKAGVERESPYILGKIQENVEEAGPIRLFGPGSALGLDQGRVELEGTVYLNGQTLEAYIQKIVAEMLG